MGESRDWMRVCRFDCLRGLGLGVASGGKSVAFAEGTIVFEVTPGRFRFELTDAGREAGEESTTLCNAMNMNLQAK